MENFVEFKTNKGSFVIGLYESTPFHRDNFIEKCQNNFYDSLLVHKISVSGLIVLGDSTSKNAKPTSVFEQSLEDTIIPAEIHPKRINTRGAVGAMRLDDEQNYSQKSSGSIFYIAYGQEFNQRKINTWVSFKNAPVYKKYIDVLLEKEEYFYLRDSLDFYKFNRKHTDYNRLYFDAMKIVEPEIKKDKIKLYSFNRKNIDAYKKLGGIPEMDNEYTVFGRIVYGIENVEAIKNERTGLKFRPRKDIRIENTRVMTKKEWRKVKKMLRN